MREARRIDADPRRDGFGHGNKQLGQPDEMWYQSLAIDRIVEEQFRNRNLSSAESEFMRLIRMGILDGREGYDFQMMASTLAMRHSSAVSMRLWVMLASERERVGFLVARAIKLC